MINNNGITQDEMLNYAIAHGMIDLAQVGQEIKMNKRKDLLNKHPYEIWKDKEGYWNTYIPTKDSRKRIKKRTLVEVEDIVCEYLKEELFSPTVREVYEEWIDRRLDIGKICKGTHERCTQIFNKHYGELGKKKIKNLNCDDFSDFLEEQLFEFDMTAKAFANLKSITKGFLLRARKRRLIDFSVEDVFEMLDVTDRDYKKRVKEDYEEVYNEDEFDAMVQYLIQNPDAENLAILLMFVTGIRVGELVAIKREDFDGYAIKIRRTETRVKRDGGGYDYLIKDFPKTESGIRTVIIPKDFWWLANRILGMEQESEFVFSNKGKRYTTNAIRARLKRNCQKLKIYPKSPHKVRKTYGTILLDNNIDKQMTTGLMGHSNIITTENHYHRNRRSDERKMEILSSINEFRINA